MSARIDKVKAVKTAAHKLARLIYAMLTRGQEYMDQGQYDFEGCYRKRIVTSLSRCAQLLGLKLVPEAATA